VIGFLRFVGLLNTAVWLGGALFFSLGVAPAVFSSDMKTLLGGNNYPYFSGAIAQLFVARYFHMQLICSLIAIVHLLVDRLYLGRTAQQLWLGLLLALFSLGLLGGFWLQPKLKQLHSIKYAASSTPEARQAADQSFRAWHGASQIANLLMICGLGIYFWHLANPPDSTRFVSTAKFRS
jgi:hypothetical protein